MKIGVVSDTHNNLKNTRRITQLFNAAQVERVIHTGDITQAKTLEAFADLNAPLTAIYGNNDLERDSLQQAAHRLGIELHDPPLHLKWHQRQILVVHDPLDLDGLTTSAHNLVLHGHTHLFRAERTETQLIFNPGECAGMMTGLNAVGLVDLESLRFELLKF